MTGQAVGAWPLASDVEREPDSAEGATVATAPKPAPSNRPPARPRLRFRRIVPGVPIVAFTGVNGAGKSLLMHSEDIADLAAGRRVVSTTPIVSPWGNSEPLRSLRQLLDLEDCTISIDEASAVFPSGATGTLPESVATFLQSMRHQRVTLRWAAPAWMRAHIQLREVTQVQVNVMPMLKYRVKGEFWPKPRIVMAGALDCTSVAVDGTPEKILARRFYRPRSLPAWDRYDHEAQVSRIGWEKRSGVCVDCGGSVPPEKCTPDRHKAMGIAERGQS